ncbi:MAG: cytosine permease [Alicyclobacillus sp.]|nr:cytosine permease [Alicyclobacillus sp.]
MSGVNSMHGPTEQAVSHEVSHDAKARGWLWHALTVGNVWVSLPVLTLAGLWTGQISTNQILVAGILGSLLGAILPWVGGYLGSRFSLPGTIISRATWGKKGGVISSVLTIAAGIGWYAVHLLLTAIAIGTVYDSIFHIKSSNMVLIILIAGLASLALAFVGIDYISKMSQWFVPALFILIVVLFIVAMNHVGWTYNDVVPAKTTMSFGSVASVSFSVFVMSFIFSADYGRYLKSHRQSFGGAIGSAFVQIFFIVVGVLMFVATGSPDLLNQLIKMNLLVLAGIVGIAVTIVTNVTNMYVSGIALATALDGYGVKIHRYLGTVLTGIVGLLLTLFVYSRMSYFSFLFVFLNGVGAAFASANAIVIVDLLLRKGKISVDKLVSESENGSYWYQGGYNWAAIVSWVVGGIFAYKLPGFTVPLVSGAIIGGIFYAILALIIPAVRHSVFEAREMELIENV